MIPIAAGDDECEHGPAIAAGYCLRWVCNVRVEIRIKPINDKLLPGMIDNNGFGVPFKLCTINSSIMVINNGINTEENTANTAGTGLDANHRHNCAMNPVATNAYIACFNVAVNAGSKP